MDGFEATRRLRANPLCRDLPIIAITANAMAGDRQRCVEAGMNAHIAKPLNIPEFYQTLARWLTPTPDGQTATTSKRVADVVAMPALPDLPGIDSESGMMHVNGKIHLYIKVLMKFRDNQGKHFETSFRQSLASGNWPDATRLAHSLKGVARTLGALRLGELTAELEAAVLERDGERVEAGLDQFRQEMNLVLRGLEGLG
jgi:HPt (histidine-containing phosphotransfer) domain-containing protein